jgi:hypothetical protein
MMRQWINEDRTVLVREYGNGLMEVATRDQPGDTWRPPIQVRPDMIQTRSEAARR